ncbi:CsbD family protein [Flaviflexus equikiangi]|uniref:CsbD family protein n=1 Tax=Flaviflexus equikiangi TaxID=2758573 RepID=A0ABS2TG18_9ACTO|nr:CsbD family protein [Flaviflexus equikiangi]MBM9432722.1 CsbD family protein [Flaviflexus equikiangi]
MGIDDKAKNEFQDLGGKAKEGAGKLTDNERLEAEGKGDQVGAKAKKAGESIKDFAKDATDKAKDLFNKDSK